MASLGGILAGAGIAAAKALASASKKNNSSSGGSNSSNGNNRNSSSGGRSNGSSGSTSSGNLVQVKSDGNAPSGTQVGDTVRTAGGDFKVVAPNTPGATYNPSSGLWSIKQTGSSGGGSAGGAASSGSSGSYTPLGTYHDQDLSAADKARVEALQQQWSAAQARGDRDTMDKVHNWAEEIRSGYGYSGGADGSQYLPSQLPEDTLPKVGLPSYQAQEARVNSVYDAARDKSLAALESAYAANRAALEAAAAQIPGDYQARANQLAANALINRRNFFENAAASGLNAGNGSQAELAMNNQQQADMTTLRTAEANAVNQANMKLTQLYVDYQNAIAEAIANNNYERAAALLSEYQKQAESIVSTARDQASLDLDIAGFNRTTNDRNYDRQLENAQTLAKFGDFSGYLALGYSADQVANMRRTWLASNPKLASNLGYW